MRPSLYIDAARNMRARQLAFRVRRLVPPSVLATRLPAGPVPEPRWHATGLGRDPAPPSGPTPPPHEDGAVSAFGIRRAVGAADFWQDGSDGLLFLFHLHGFADLARYASEPRSPAGDAFWAQVLEDWLACERQPSLPAWHPYPTSERIVAWTAALSTIGAWPETLRRRLTAELWRQTAYLRRCVEHDIGGNHVLRNGVALAFAGAVFPDAPVLGHALALLRRETGSQFLGDGAHEERSTSYHHRAWHDLVEVIELLDRVGQPAPEWLTSTAARANAWQARIAGPDKRLPMLNDAWEGPPLLEASTERVVAAGESGYLVLRRGPDQVLFDVGPLGPAHLPAHAHADALSFVLWLDGRPLIIDPGSYQYTGPWRDQLRGTAAHNSVEVDGRDQCVLWGSFRAAYLPSVRHTSPTNHGDAVVVAGAHDGYRRLSDPVEHQRALVWAPPLGLVVIDRLRARRPHRMRSTLHLAPDALVTNAGTVGQIAFSALGTGAAMHLEEGVHSPYLGSIVSAPTLVDSRTVDPGQLFGWSVLRGGWRVGKLTPARLTLERDGERPVTVALDWA